MIEYKRKYSIVHLTEEGLFHENQLPADYDGAVLNIEVVHRILMVDEVTGELHPESYNPPEAKNSGRAVVAYPAAGVKIREATVNETFVDGRHYFPQRVKDLADFYISSLENTNAKVI